MKKPLLLFLTATASCLLPAFSQAQEIEWQNTIGGSSNDELYSIQQTSDGGYILGGYSNSNISGDKTENNIGVISTSDYWIVKLDATGSIQWQNTIGGNYDDRLLSLSLTADGGYICGGWSTSNISGDKTESCAGGSDYWVIKLDANGNIQWQNTIAGDYVDYLYSISQTNDGGYICGGYSNSEGMYDKTENCLGAYDYWIIKLDATGNIQWQNTIGGGSNDELFSLVQTSDGGYICGGSSDSDISGDKTENSLGDFDYWVIKLDASGNIQWQNTIGGNNDDILCSISQTSDGGYICGGESWSNISGDKTENSLAWDYWILKLDTSGNILWQNTIGGNNWDELNSIQQTSDGGYILGGYSISIISGDKTENSLGFEDYWVVKLDTSGNIQWQNTIGGSDHDWLSSIRQNVDGTYICGGYSLSSFSGDKLENSLGSKDYWVAKLTDKYNSFTGKLFIDLNSNQIQDAGEPDLKNYMVSEQSTGRIGFSLQSGDYSIFILDTGSFFVIPAFFNSYYAAIPLNHNAYFTSFLQTDSLNDFAYQPAGVFNDLCITITPLGAFRAGFNASYMVNYENVGTTTLNPTVIFFADTSVTYVSSVPAASSVTTDSVVWNFGPLAPFQTGGILVTVNVNLGTPIGTLINSSVEIDPVAGDANTACNYHAWEVFTTGAVDPNDIIVDEDTLLTTQFPNPPYLEYIIRFQNTGNDTAFNARVLNNIPQRLDVNTFEFVASSHPVNINYGAHSRLFTFTFDNILLPDSNVNEPASHGFVRYRIKPKSNLVAGNKIFNKAFIYFDFNQPVETNNAVTEIVLPTGISHQSLVTGQLKIYPNPAHQTIKISFSSITNDQYEMTICDLYGRTVFEKQQGTLNEKPETTIDISGLSQGTYFIEVHSSPPTGGRSGGTLSRAKFVKQ